MIGATNLHKDIPPIEPTDTTMLIKNITFTMSMMNDNTLRAVYEDYDDHARWNARDSGLFDDIRDDYGMRLKNVGFNPNSNEGFGWTVYDFDDASSSPIISTEGTGLRFFSNFIEISFMLPSNRLFGLGEHISSFMLEEGKYTMWSNGHDNEFIHRNNGTGNMYGVHPFIMGQ